MTRPQRRPDHVVAVTIPLFVLGAVLIGPEILQGQVTRNERIAAADAAWGNLDYARAQNLLTLALDPRAGPADSTWAKGVQLLAQILLDGDNAGRAGVWLRWGFRVNPDLPIDSLTYTPELVAEAITARQAAGTGSPGDSVTRTSWDWPATQTADSTGRLRVDRKSLTSPLRVLIQGPRATLGALAGETLTLQAGTYVIQAAADGYFTARVSREVLPGVTTVLGFDLRPVVVAAAPPRDTVRADTLAPVAVVPPRDSVRADTGAAVAVAPIVVEPPPPAVVTPKAAPRQAEEPPKTVAPAPVIRKGKSKLPFIVGGGVAAAGVAVYLLLPKPQVETGSVTGTIPVNPPGSD